MNEIINKGHEYFVGCYKQFDVSFVKGEGCTLTDANGKEYLDFVAGIAVNSLGYSNDTLKSELKNQIDNLLHVSNLYWNEKAVTAAEKLVKISGLDKVFFCNSGAEANEGAFKLARKYAKKFVDKERFEIISMNNSFHGRTLATITATGQAKYQKDLDPLFPGIKYANYNDIESLRNTITDKTCAIILEPLQGEGGINPARKAYLEEVRAICDEKDIVLIFDEVQTGVGRSGEMFAFQYFGVKPDILSLAKGLGGGVPIGAIVVNEKVAKGFEPGDHAATFGGNLLSATAANVVLDEIIGKNILDNVKEMGAYLTEKLVGLKEKYPETIKDVRGFGLIQGIELAEEGMPLIIVEKAMEAGLLLIGAGGNTIRFVPPLVVTKEDINKAMDILENTLK